MKNTSKKIRKVIITATILALTLGSSAIAVNAIENSQSQLTENEETKHTEYYNYVVFRQNSTEFILNNADYSADSADFSFICYPENEEMMYNDINSLSSNIMLIVDGLDYAVNTENISTWCESIDEEDSMYLNFVNLNFPSVDYDLAQNITLEAGKVRYVLKGDEFGYTDNTYDTYDDISENVFDDIYDDEYERSFDDIYDNEDDNTFDDEYDSNEETSDIKCYENISFYRDGIECFLNLAWVQQDKTSLTFRYSTEDILNTGSFADYYEYEENAQENWKSLISDIIITVDGVENTASDISSVVYVENDGYYVSPIFPAFDYDQAKCITVSDGILSYILKLA